MNEQEKTPALAQISPPFYGQECIVQYNGLKLFLKKNSKVEPFGV